MEIQYPDLIPVVLLVYRANIGNMCTDSGVQMLMSPGPSLENVMGSKIGYIAHAVYGGVTGAALEQLRTWSQQLTQNALTVVGASV